MNQKISGRARLALAGALAVLLVGAVALAQDFARHRGDNARTGQPSLSPSTPGGTAKTVYNNPGESNLRWWNPQLSDDNILDNDLASPNGTAGAFSGTWNDPAALGHAVQAVGAELGNQNIPYRLTRNVAQTAGTSDPKAGNTAAFRWRFTGLVPGDEYQVSVSIPIGPSSVGNTFDPNSDFPQQFYVYEVVDGTGTESQIVDTFNTSPVGNFIRLGNNGQSTNRLYVANAAGEIDLFLYNTTPRRTDGTFLDGGANPGNQWVYADAAKVEGSITSPGGYISSPIVAELANSVLAANNSRRYRVFAGRNETLSSGRLGEERDLVNFSSYIYDGSPINAIAQPRRLNVAWSWPVRKPLNNGDAEQQRYNREREDWIFGPLAGNERHTVRIQTDNTSAGVSIANALFTPGAAAARNAFVGPNYLEADAVITPTTAGATDHVRFPANVRPGNYFIQAWMPNADSGAELAREALYEVWSNGVKVGQTLVLNQSIGNGWVTLPGQISQGYASNGDFGNLEVRVFNASSDAGDAGRKVFADAVRFVGQADLRLTSTPVYASADMNSSITTAQADVVIVPTEDGRIYCIEAEGDVVSGNAPGIHWTYPSPNPAVDPNRDPSIDGGVTDVPTGFGRSSGLVARVDGADYFYIAGTNGRVMCLRVDGENDGSTRREWSFPSDYVPDNPTGVRSRAFKAIVGSIAFGTVAGIDGIVVPTQEGQLWALAAKGVVATRTTAVLWQADADDLVAGIQALGPILSTPLIQAGRVYVNAQADQTAGSPGVVFCFDAANGNLIWRSDRTTAGTFAAFGTSSPLFVEAADITAGIAGDAIFVCDMAGRFMSIDPVTGARKWFTDEVASGASGSPVFTYQDAFNNAGIPIANTPMVMVPTFGGSIVGIHAGGVPNKSGTFRFWQFDLEGGPTTDLAVGGWKTGDTSSWMYGAGADGILYAFNDDPGIITPGRRPGFRIIVENDPASDLNTTIDPTKFKLLSPEGYQKVTAELQANTLTAAKLTAYAAADAVTRRNFEIGESMHLMIHDLPELPTIGNYQIEIIVSAPGYQQRRQIPVRPIFAGANGPNSRFWISQFAFQPSSTGGPTPGNGTVKVRITTSGRRVPASAEVPLPGGANGAITTANPLALLFRNLGNVGVANSIGNDRDAALPINQINGNINGGAYVIDPVGTAGPKKESLTTAGQLPGSFVGPSIQRAGDLVSHGSTGALQMEVRDRSMTRLLLGRGLPGVRLFSEDLAWQVGAQPHRNTYKPLSENVGASYPGFEDPPTVEPNRSLDYPDMSRANLAAAKSAFGRTENPIFTPVTLNPPVWHAADLSTYVTSAGFDAQMIRSIAPTPFDLNLNVPRYTPASGPEATAPGLRPGYRGVAYAYCDNGTGRFMSSVNAHRAFALAARISPDERIEVGTPTVDLASMPHGAGFDGGAPLSPGVNRPAVPWETGSLFRPYNGYPIGAGGLETLRNRYRTMYQPVTVYNDGNVNLLNVRVAKAFDRPTGIGVNRIFRPLQIYAPGQQDMAWLEGRFHVLTSLDPLFTDTGAERSNLDPQARAIVQKPRVGDSVSARLSVNPIRRANPNLGVSTGALIPDLVNFPTGDPRISVAIPIGTPVGDYIRQMFVFEDTQGSNGGPGSGTVPSLGPRQTGGLLTADNIEAYSEPGFTLKFTVREARLTNRPTTKSPALVDNLVVGTENFYWDNTQPSIFRTGDGHLFTAWSSNRKDAANLPGFGSRPKNPLDTALADTWRIYISGVTGSQPGAGSSVGLGALNDLNGFNRNSGGGVVSPDRVFGNRFVMPDSFIGAPQTLFSLDPSFTVNPTTMSFGGGAFSSGGPHDFSSSAVTNGIRPFIPNRAFAFLGSAAATDSNGGSRTVNQIMLANMVFAADGSMTVNGFSTMPWDPFSQKSRPAIAQGTGSSLVTWTSFAGGSGQVLYSLFRNGAFSQPTGLLPGSFERVGAPSVTLRRYRNGVDTGTGNDVRAEISFPAKRRGRTNGEVFMGRLFGSPAGGNGPSFGRNAQTPFSTRVDELSVETGGSIFWSPGAVWRTNPEDLDPTATPGVNDSIDLFQLTGGAFTSIIDPATQAFDLESGLLSFRCLLGGRVSIDTKSGAIRLIGVVLPRSVRLFVRSTPYYLAVSTVSSSNYRSVSSLYDDRLIGVQNDPVEPLNNLLGDLDYWFTESGGKPTATALIRSDRFLYGFSRTSGDGSQPARPSLRSLRFGIQLPSAVRLAANGQPVSLVIDWAPPGVPAIQQVPPSERFYQVDPASGKIFFLAGAEDRVVRVRYQGVDETGTPTGLLDVTRSVDLLSEMAEAPVQIEQASNESALSMMLNPSNAEFNSASIRGPGLIWMAWTSQRTGGPEVFFQTVAPRFFPRSPTP